MNLDLDQSPISLNEEVQMIESGDQSSEDGQEQPFEAETFKGSFLQQMERLSRPLYYEKQRYCIYSLQYEEDTSSFLTFIEQEEPAHKFTYALTNQSISQYILNFETDQCFENCSCKCHETTEPSTAALFMKKHKNKEDLSQEQKGYTKSMNLTLNEVKQKDEQARGAINNMKWNTLSLKEYKMRIKKKLQQKR